MNSISLESLREASTYNPNITLDYSNENFITDLFNRFSSGIKDSWFNLRGYTELQKIDNKKNRFLDLVDNNNYLSLAPLKVNIPEGLKVDFLTFVKILEPVNAFVAGTEDDVIKPFRKYLAKLISEPQSRHHVDTQLMKTINDKTKLLDKLMFTLTSSFDGTHNKFSTYEKIVEKNRDWYDIIEASEKLIDYKKIDRKHMAKQVGELVALLDALKEVMDNEPEFIKLNPGLNKTISELTDKVAANIAFIATAFFHTQTFITNLNANISDLTSKLQ